MVGSPWSVKELRFGDTTVGIEVENDDSPRRGFFPYQSEVLFKGPSTCLFPRNFTKSTVR